MPVTYHYANENPPAPFVLVLVRNPLVSSGPVELPAKLDTGADQTVIPAALADQLGLTELGRVTFAGLGDVRSELPVFEVELVIRGLRPLRVEVVGSAGEPYVLLGRDVLNLYRIVFDGPRGKVEFP